MSTIPQNQELLNQLVSLLQAHRPLFLRQERVFQRAHWLHNPQSPVLKRGIHMAQRRFNGSWLLPEENGCSRAPPALAVGLTPRRLCGCPILDGPGLVQPLLKQISLLSRQKAYSKCQSLEERRKSGALLTNSLTKRQLN